MAETPQPRPWHRIARQALDYRCLRYMDIRLDRFRVSFQNA